MIAIGEYVLPVISYTFGVLNWTEEEIKNVDIHIRKRLNLYRMFSLKSDVDRLYTPRSMGGRGLLSAWDNFQCTMVRLSHYMTNMNNRHIEMCTLMEKNTIFSITKKAEKF